MRFLAARSRSPVWLASSSSRCSCLSALALNVCLESWPLPPSAIAVEYEEEEEEDDEEAASDVDELLLTQLLLLWLPIEPYGLTLIGWMNLRLTAVAADDDVVVQLLLDMMLVAKGHAGTRYIHSLSLSLRQTVG